MIILVRLSVEYSAWGHLTNLKLGFLSELTSSQTYAQKILIIFIKYSMLILV